MNLDEIRTLIASKAVEFVLATIDIFALIFCTFTGSGKTTSVLNAIDKAALRWIYVGPTHKVIDSNIKRSKLRNFSYVHMEGRERLCVQPELKALAKQGINISSFCEECGFNGNACKYNQQQQDAIRKMPNLAITHAHIQNFLPRFLDIEVGSGTIRDNYDVIIIDENPITCFLKEKTLLRREVGYLRDCLTMSRMDPLLIRIVELLYSEDLDYDTLRTLPIDTLNPMMVNTRFSNAIADLYQRGDIEEIPVNIFPFIFEIYNRMMHSPLDQMIYYRQGILNLTYFRPNALDLGLRIIGLDGTANEAVWHHMLDRDDFEIFNIDYQYVNAYQLNGGHYPIMSWRRKNSTIPETLCSLVDKIAETKTRKVLFVGTKAVNRKAKRLLKSKNIEFAVYYNLRSRNEFYEKSDTIILGVEPNPPQEKIICCVTLSHWDESIWRRIFREEEMLQAIGRLRQNIDTLEDGTVREKMEVFILPSTGVIESEIKWEGLHYSTLLPEAQVLSKTNLVDMLDNVGHYDKKFLHENIILTACPISMSRFMVDYGVKRRLAEKYFKYMVKHGLIRRWKKQYEITERGRSKLTIEEKHTRGLVERALTQ